MGDHLKIPYVVDFFPSLYFHLSIVIFYIVVHEKQMNRIFDTTLSQIVYFKNKKNLRNHTIT